MASPTEILPAIDRVLIVGAGWVGRQVAARMAQHGLEVWLFDRKRLVCEQAVAWMQSLDGTANPNVAATNYGDWISRVHIADDLQLSEIQLVVENVPEQISLKRRVLQEVSQRFLPPTIIASNSSYFTPSVLSRFVESPSRFAHVHFHVPVLHESVADIVGCEHTDPQVLDQLALMSARIGQPPLRLRHEHPGYVFNWLLQSVLRASLELVAQDVVDPQDVDRSWKAVTGMSLGPFGMMDQIGLDVIEQVLSNARWAEPSTVTLDQLIAVLQPPLSQGHLGVKTQRGFYDYADEDAK